MSLPIGAFSNCRQGASQNVAYNAAGGASAASTAFAAQTRAIRVCAPGVVSATSGVHIIVGDGTPTASATTTLLAINYAVTDNLSVTELSLPLARSSN